MGAESVRSDPPRPGSALVADPYPVSLAAVAALLRRSGIVADTYEATSETGALTTARRRGVDLVVLDAHLDRPRSGLQLCRELKRLACCPTVLVFTGANDPTVVTACMANGADGFVHRSATPERFVDAVQSTVAGRPVWFLGEPFHEDGPTGPEAVTTFAEMTGREHEVLTLLLGRYSNEEIAAELSLARQTVKNLVSSVLQKTGAANRRELVQLARPAPGRRQGGAADERRREHHERHTQGDSGW